MASTPNTRRWAVGIWPSTVPPRPGLAFPGPVGLWDGSALFTFDLAEHQGFIDDTRFRPPPLGNHRNHLEANGERCKLWEREEQSGRGETYLRLAEIDLDDDDQVLDFASTFGFLDIRALDPPRLSRQWWGNARAVEPPVPLRALRFYPGFGDHSRHASLDGTLREEVLRSSEAARRTAPVWLVAETIEEFRWAARAICDLRQAWRCLRDGLDPREVDWRNPRLPGAALDRGHADWLVAEFFERTLRDALAGFSLRVWLVDSATERAALRAHTRPEPPDVTLYEVMCLELFRHIAEDASYKRCANPSCGHVFVRQEGGAMHGQSRMTGVKYCTRTCASAVAQRRYRTKRRARPG